MESLEDKDYVRTLEERLATTSDRLEDLHMVAAIDAQLSASPHANPDPDPDPDGDEPTETRNSILFDDYINPDSVQNCLSPYMPTKADRISAFVSFVGLSQQDVLLDIGCGDGRICISAVKLTGCFSVGIDVSPACVRIARHNAIKEGLQDSKQCIFFQADATIDPADLLTPESPLSTVLRSVTVVFLYTYPTLLNKLVPLLEWLMQDGKATKVVTLTYHLPSDLATVQKKDEVHDLCLYSRISSQ